MRVAAIAAVAVAVVVATMALAPAADASPATEVRATVRRATGEVNGAPLGLLAAGDMRDIAELARERGVTFAWPTGIDDAAVLRRLDDSGLLRRVTSLSLACATCVTRLAGARHAGAIRRLRVAGCATDEYLAYHHVACIWLDARAARALGASRRLPAVVELTVTARGPALVALLAGRLAASVRALDVITDADGIAALGRARTLTGLESLAIFAAENSAGAVRTLVSSRHLRALATLRFHSSDSEAERSLDAAGVRAIAAAMKLPALRTLDLSWAYVGDDAIAVLAAAPWLEQLERLGLIHTGAGAATLATFNARGAWPALDVLWLDGDLARPTDIGRITGFDAVLADEDRWFAEMDR